MPVKLEEDHCSLVVVGGFDPQRFHPTWFRDEKLIGASEADQAELKLVAPEIADWATDWLHIQVLPNKLVAIATVASRAEQLRDLVVSVLQLLEKTVTVALGINRNMKFSLPDVESWHRVGDTLAPKTLWTPHLRARPGMRVVQIEDTKRNDNLPGKTIVTVQPAPIYPNGVSFDVNNEITADGRRGTLYFQSVIRDRSGPLLEEAKAMAHSVLEGAQR